MSVIAGNIEPPCSSAHRHNPECSYEWRCCRWQYGGIPQWHGLNKLIFIIRYWFSSDFLSYSFLFSSFVLDQNHFIFRRHGRPPMPMLHFLFNLPDTWLDMLCTHILCSFNVNANFEYVPITNKNHVLLGGLDSMPNFILRIKFYLILDLELVLVRDTSELTILNDLVKSPLRLCLRSFSH